MALVDEVDEMNFMPAGDITEVMLEALADDWGPAVAAFKAAKLETNGNGKLRATVEEDGGDAEGGPQTETVEFDDDDEDGRFFGGGVSKQESEILDYIDKQDQEGEIKVGSCSQTGWSF